MAKRQNSTPTAETSAATVGHEAQLWHMADALRGSMDAAEYKHVLGFVFLKYISDAFDEQHAKLLSATKSGADPEDPGEYRALKMNLARGIGGQIAHGDTIHNDRRPDLKADFILANPPFNVSDWGGERLRDDKRWQYGTSPAGNANFAWVQYIVHHLAPASAPGFVLANGCRSSSTSRRIGHERF